LAKVGLFWTLVLVLSTLLFKYFEKPVTDLRNRLVDQGTFSIGK
jgi:peptidoglycan/LPS O-acetylase OafA/YrhL